MKTRNWEDWTMGLSVAVAAALAITLSSARGPSLTSEAVAAEPKAPQYEMVVTAKRLPANCKGLSEAAMTAECAALINGTTIRLTKNY